MLNLAEELLLLALQDEKGTVLASAAGSLPTVWRGPCSWNWRCEAGFILTGRTWRLLI